MKFFAIYIVMFLLAIQVYAQANLVPNYSFEDSVICPTATNGGPMPKPWYVPSNFNTYSYWNSCSLNFSASVPNNTFDGGISFQSAKTGNGYAGLEIINNLMLNSRSYIQIKLKDSLRAAKCYYCSFWVSLANPMKGGCNNLGMWLTNTKKYVDTIANPFGFAVIPGDPQILNYGNPIVTDTLNWVKISGVYTAIGGEQFITIGNFKSDANTTYKTVNPNGINSAGYYIDDVSVIPLDSIPLPADAGKDTSIRMGDSAFIGSLTNGLTNIAWYDASGTLIDNSRPGYYVRPTASTFYVLQQTVYGYYSSDTVYIAVQPALPLNLISFTTTLQRNSQAQVQWNTTNEVSLSHFVLQRSNNGTHFTAIHQQQANNGTNNSYSFTDDLATVNHQFPTIFYRLYMVDKNGAANYSKVVFLQFPTATSNSAIFPNPAKEAVTIEGNDLQKVQLLDMYGKILRTKELAAGATTTTLTLSNISNGVYFIKTTDYKGKVAVTKIIKN